MVATDGHRLAYAATLAPARLPAQTKVDALIPRKALAELAKMLAAPEEEIRFGADENHMHFAVGSRTLSARLLVGTFPDYLKVLPASCASHLTCDGQTLSGALKRTSLMSEERTQGVYFHLSAGQLLLSARSAEEGEAREPVAVEYEGAELETGFNAAYLLDFLRLVNGSGQVRIGFNNVQSQFELRPVTTGEFDFRYVVMPLRL